MYRITKSNDSVWLAHRSPSELLVCLFTD